MRSALVSIAECLTCIRNKAIIWHDLIQIHLYFIIAKGLPPLPPKTDASASKSSTAEKASGKPSDPLSFSTKTQNGPKKPSTSKRKAVGDAEPDDQRREKAPNKKKKKESKGLLSFGEGLE
jgi:hypothetical protein